MGDKISAGAGNETELPRYLTMKRDSAYIAVAGIVSVMAVAGCTAIDRGMAGNIYEKMTVFSMIVFFVFAIVFIPFLTGKGNNKVAVGYREAVKGAPASHLPLTELTADPLYVWDSRRSYKKMLFADDGSFSESTIIRGNGEDPKTLPAGSWEAGSDGTLNLSYKLNGSSRSFTCIATGGYHLPAIMRLISGYVEAWYLGIEGLALAQISCFGYSDSLPPTEKFTAALIKGVTVYWATYPCVLPVSEGEISVNPELAYGMMVFQEDGTLTKSINNPIEGKPDYNPSFTGTWRMDEKLGVLNLSAGLYTTEVVLHLHDAKRNSLIIGTTAGNEQWFLDQQHGKEDLASYLSLGVNLDVTKRAEFM
jgi:hypothetical protein